MSINHMENIPGDKIMSASKSNFDKEFMKEVEPERAAMQS